MGDTIDWLADLQSWCETNAARRRVACNPDDVERVQAAADGAGIADLVDVTPMYILPRGYAMVTDPDEHIDTGVSEEFFAALTLRKYI